MSPKFVYLLGGILVGILIIYLDSLALRFQIVLLFGIIGIFFLLVINSYNKLFRILLALIPSSIPFTGLTIGVYRPIGINTFGQTTSVGISLNMILVFILFLIMVHKRFLLGEKHFALNRQLVFPVIAYIVAGILSLLNATHPEFVAADIVNTLILLGIMLVIMNLKNERDIYLFVLFLLLGVLVQGIIACTQYTIGKYLGLERLGEEQLMFEDIDYVSNRAGGTIGHPNILAYYLEMLLPLNLALFLVEPKFKIRIYLLGTLGIGLAALIFSLCRGAWITTPISFSIVFFVLFKDRLSRLPTILFFLLAGSFLLGVLHLTFPLIEKRLTADDYGSAAGRMPLNEAALSLIKRFPVVGVGLNNLAEVFHKYDKTGKSRIIRGAGIVHNLFLWVWAEVGTIGLFSFLWIFISVFWIIRNLLFKANLWHKGLLIGIGAGLFAHLIHGLVDVGFRISWPVSVLVYTLIGLAGSISIRNQRRHLLEKGIRHDSLKL
jgi:O-antigen ligase